MAEQARIESIRLVGVFGHQQLLADFKPGLNLVHGKNGTGKTTLLHVLANLLECDLFRFCNISFERLIVRLHDGTEIVLQQQRGLEQRGGLEQRAGIAPTKIRVFLGGSDLGEIVPTGAPLPDSISSAFAKLFPARPVYLPAFRSILEAADEREQFFEYRETEASRREFREIKESEERYVKDRRHRPAGRILENPGATASKTVLSRRWFGSFVPIVRYPSVADVSRQLRDELEGAYVSVNRTNQQTFSTVFSEVLRVFEKRVPQVGGGVGSLLDRVQTHLQALVSKESKSAEGSEQIAPLFDRAETTVSDEEESIRAILQIYDSALSARAAREKEVYKSLHLLENSFNRFIGPKALQIFPPGARRRLAPTVAFPNGYRAKLEALSSGERQVLTMLFCATHMSPADGIMLIDEPEISLHVDWQRIILDEIMLQAGDRQVIVCTHSPEVVAEHRDALVKLGSEAWSPGDGRPAESDAESEPSSGD